MSGAHKVAINILPTIKTIFEGFGAKVKKLDNNNPSIMTIGVTAKLGARKFNKRLDIDVMACQRAEDPADYLKKTAEPLLRLMK